MSGKPSAPLLSCFKVTHTVLGGTLQEASGICGVSAPGQYDPKQTQSSDSPNGNVAVLPATKGQKRGRGFTWRTGVNAYSRVKVR